MKGFGRIHLAIAGAGLAVVAGLTVFSISAMASSPSPSASPGSAESARATACTSFHDYFVKAIGKPSADVDAAFTKALGQTLADQVKAGTITQAQADSIKQRSSAQSFCATGFMGARQDGLGWPGRHGVVKLHEAVATALGITSTELSADFAKGMTVHQIAGTKGITEAQFTSALQAAEQAQVDSAVRSGSLTQAQADAFAQQRRSGAVAMLWDSAGFHHGGRGMMPAPAQSPSASQ